jgi:hypothetical protein
VIFLSLRHGNFCTAHSHIWHNCHLRSYYRWRLGVFICPPETLCFTACPTARSLINPSFSSDVSVARQGSFQGFLGSSNGCYQCVLQIESPGLALEEWPKATYIPPPRLLPEINSFWRNFVEQSTVSLTGETRWLRPSPLSCAGSLSLLLSLSPSFGRVVCLAWTLCRCCQCS